MPSDFSEPPSLEESLGKYFGSADPESHDLRKLLTERPELAKQLRELLNDHDRATAAEQSTLLGDASERGAKSPASTTSRPDVPPSSLHASADSSTAQPRQSASGPTTSDQSFPESTAGAPRPFADYQLLEEIARGGMGVVYRARQISLDRPVAVKMILSGQLAGEGDVARFYAEAEAAAQLNHPGIVPIYEVGKQGGQHFFAMAFVEGSSLADRIRKGPLTCVEASEILRQVADAIEYAHEQGVIHRDLKPANVLIDAKGLPQVTDFGVAKRVGRQSQLTISGQVLGTPGYMPPEQAGGQSERIGPASDVYSLGALLYASLTGRPPFQATTPVDTLMQVLERDPIPPRQLNPGVDRDLETICLKCLQKEPEQRYATAREVAAEIGRYQRGEPILARPVSPREILWRWHTRLRENKVVRVRSTGGIGRIPWVDIAVGPDTETGQQRGVAKGIIAIGDTAWGVLAFGESARGLVAFGKYSYGVVAIGLRAIGLLCCGALGLGLCSLSAVSVAPIAFGGIAIGYVGVGSIVFARYAAGALCFGEYVVSIGRDDPEALEFFGSWVRRLFGGS